MIKHWVKLYGTNQYNINDDLFKLMKVPKTHKFVVGDSYLKLNSIFTLVSIQGNSNDDIRCYWNEEESTKNVGAVGIFKGKS